MQWNNKVRHQANTASCMLVKSTGVLKHGIRWTTHLQQKIKKIRANLLPSGNLVDMQGNISVAPENLAANPEVRMPIITFYSLSLSLSLSLSFTHTLSLSIIIPLPSASVAIP